MSNQNNTQNIKKGYVANMHNAFFQLKPHQTMASLINFSRIFFAFSILFLGAYLFKLFNIHSDAIKHFNLVFAKINILPLYSNNLIGFIFIAAYEAIKITLVAITLFYFTKFLKSLDISDPFKNFESKKYIQRVALLSMIFFAIDALSAIHLNYYESLLSEGTPIHIFHFEYLFLAYFINVFAVIFNRGVDLKNEIDLVI